MAEEKKPVTEETEAKEVKETKERVESVEVEEKAESNEKAESMVKTEGKAKEAAKDAATKEVKAEEAAKEAISESEIIDINKESEKREEKSQDKKKETAPGRKKSPKTTEDFIAKQKKRKRTRKFITLLIVVCIIVAIVLWAKNAINKTKEAFKDLQANSVQTATVEKKTLYDSKDATGTLYARDSVTITRSLQGTGQGGAQITEVNVEVGDHVNVDDLEPLVKFSSENIEKSIEEAKEDIGTQKKLDAITAGDAQRDYVYSYTSVANSIQSAVERTDRALKALHEACDAYGDAKRERDDYKENHQKDINYESMLKSYEDAVTRAFQNQETAQQNYDDAVENQAKTINDSQTGNGSLSSADSNYQKAQINSGEQVKKLQRQLNNSIDSLDDYEVFAPISGVVTEVNVAEGNTFVSGSVLTIQDDSGFKADVLIDEYDIPKVKKAYKEKEELGQYLEVVVKTDATGDKEYRGHVTKIAPTSTSTTAVSVTTSSTSNGVTSTASSSSTANYKVSVELDEVDEAFMIGMSAKVAIVVDESPDNSLCVPYNCIEEKDGKYYVRVMDENGDKNTADSMMQGMNGKSDNAGKSGGKSRGHQTSAETKGVNGIVIEKNSYDSDKNEHSDRNGKKNSFLSKLTADKGEEPVELGRRYREEEVDKIFETDFYAAVVPKKEGSIKEGDEVMIVTEKSSGNDIMTMFGGPGGPGGF